MRLIDADALIKRFETKSDELMEIKEPVMSGTVLGATYMIGDAPTIDAVLVVRCRECKHFLRCDDEEDLSDFGKCLELRGESTQAGSMIFFPNEMFCDYGERGVEN